MTQIVKVAVIQLYPKPLQLEHNFNKAANFVRSAAAQGAELAVLPGYHKLCFISTLYFVSGDNSPYPFCQSIPTLGKCSRVEDPSVSSTSTHTNLHERLIEYHLTNWKPKEPGFAELCTQWELYLNKYKALAKECGICIVPGTIVESHPDEDKEENRLLNVAYFIDHQGEVVGKYVKKNLWGPERDHLTASTRHEIHEVFDTPIGKVGLLICWDLAFPEAFRELIAQGAKIIIIPTFWTLNDCNEAGLKINPSAEALFLDSMLTARAFENTCAIVFSNAGGPPGRGYAGLSQVTAPFIGALTRMGSCTEGMIVVDLDMQILEDAEANYQVRADLASEDWHYDYRHTRRGVGRGEVRSGSREDEDGARTREKEKL